MAVCPNPSSPPPSSTAPPAPSRLPTRWFAAIATLSSAASAARRWNGSTSWGSAECVIIDSVGDNMIRTQISLDEQEYALVKKEAKALGISIAELIRRAVRQTLPARKQPPWMRYAGFVESGNANSSQSIDDIVYGSKD